MGKRAQWSAKDWELYYSSSWEDPSYGRHQKQWGKGGGKDGGKTKDTGAFPTYEEMPVGSKAKSKGSGAAGAGQSAAEQATTGTGGPGFSKSIQKVVNNLRRCETRLRRIEEEATEISQKWEAWQTQMKRSFITERAKYYEAVNKLKAEKQEMQEAQEEALEDLHGALARPPGDEMEIETVPEEAQRDWTALLEDAEKQEDVASKVSGVMGRHAAV